MTIDKALILTDGKAGHENQSKAFALALGLAPVLVEVHFKSKFHKALSYLCDHLGVHTTAVFDGDPLRRIGESANRRIDEFSVVLGAGSGTFYAAKTLAKKLGVKCGVVLYPRGYRLSTFDCVLAPTFDRPAKAPNIIEIPANLVAADKEFYAKGVAAFREHYAKVNGCEVPDGDAVAVIVGGPNKCSTMSADWLQRELDAIFSQESAYDPSIRKFDDSKDQKLHFYVTTSRRTPPEVEALVDRYPWDYKLLYSKDHFNPIPAFVQLAKKLYVTAESTGMLSEACTFGAAEVHALDNLEPGQHKFRRFVENLRRDGYLDGSRKVDLSAQFTAAKRLLAMRGAAAKLSLPGKICGVKPVCNRLQGVSFSRSLKTTPCSI